MSASSTSRPGRNQPCHCGSGRKYKQCCLAKDEELAAAARAEAAAEETAAAKETSDAVASTPARTPKHQTQQPWKGATSRGFASRPRMPRKVGGG